MADIVTGTVSGMVDVSGLVRDTSDVRREVAQEAHHITDRVSAESNVGQRDASAYFIAETQASTQNAKEVARSQAWTEAKIDAGFAKVAGDTALATAITNGVVALEAAKLNGANALQHALIAAQIAADGNATRALLNATRIDELRDQSGERYAKIVELENDAKYCNRHMQQSQFQTLQNQLQMMNSDLQTTKQNVISFGAGTATGGAQTSNVAH
jgi:hypothetical protein